MSCSTHPQWVHESSDCPFCAIQPQLVFSKEQALALWKYLEHEHIPYEDDELLAAVRKLSRFVDKVSE